MQKIMAAVFSLFLFITLPYMVYAKSVEPLSNENLEFTDTLKSDEEDAASNLEEITTSESAGDLDGFMSEDDSTDMKEDNTIHVIIEDPNSGNNNSSGDITSEDQVADPGESSGGDYSYSSVGSAEASGSSGEVILHKPQILLEDSNLSGQSLKAGSSTEISLTFRNKSRSQKLFGLKISLSTETKGIEFDQNSFYVQRLTPGEAITLKQNMTISEDTEPGQVTLTCSLEYEDSKATGTTGTELLAFYVVQPVRAELEASDIPSIFYTMDTVEIPVKVLNLGRDKIYNARVRLEAVGLNPKETVFLGNVEAGTSVQGSMRVYVKGLSTGDSEQTADGASGNTDGKLFLTYEDSHGNSYENAIDFTSEIKEATIQSLKVEDDQEETNSWWYSVFAVAIVLFLSIILFLLARLRKKSVLLEEARKAGAN